MTTDFPKPRTPQTPAPADSDRMSVGQRSLSDALALSLRVLRGIIVVVALLFLLSGFFQVDEGEVAVVLRFGRIRGEPGKQLLQPGAHWVWPYPIEERLRFPVKRHRLVRSTVFWRWQPGRDEPRSEKPDEHEHDHDHEGAHDEHETPPAPTGPGLDPRREGYCLTSDLGIIHTVWTVRYQVADVIAFLRSVGDPPVEIPGGPEGVISRLESGDRLVETCLRAAVIRTAAHYSVDDIYRHRSEAFRAEVEDRLNRQLERLACGIRVPENGCQMESRDPPTAVRDAFEDVVKGELDKARVVSAAQAEQARIGSEAEGEAAAIGTAAELYKARTVEEAASDARNLKLLLEKYAGQPEALRLFLRKRLLEVVGALLADAEEKFIIRRAPAGDDQFEINVGRDPEVRRQKRLETIRAE
jgi:membrane protease subunit HflK